MTGVFGGSPHENIKETERLYQNLDKVLSKKPNCKITDLFCIQTKNGLEFIDKYSFTGRWEAFKNRISMFFGGANRLDLAKNLTVASTLLTKVSQLDDKYFLQTARSENKDPQDLQDHIQELAIRLKQIHTHAVSAKSLKGKDVKPLSAIKFTVFGKNIPTLSDEQRDPELLTAQLKMVVSDLSDAEYQACGRFLNTYAERGEIFRLLSYAKAETPTAIFEDVKAKVLPELKIALLKAISFSPERETESYQAIFNKISPVAAPVSEKVSIKNIGMVFGDSFVKDSGLEGDVNSRPYAELMADCLAQPHLPQTEKSKALQTVLKNSLSLRTTIAQSAKDFKTELKERIDSDERCLILGGWSDHAVVYEVEKQPNGKYSFRIFNEGAGIQFHKHTHGKYRDKVDGCIALCDIPEKLLFKKAFLGSLQAITSLQSTGTGAQNPASVLVNHILPMLGGKQEEVPPGVQTQLSPQRSGTCTYKALLAWLANSMPEQEYKLAKVELKLYMLKTFLPSLQELSKTAVESDLEYHELRKDYAIIKRSVEKFSSSLENLKLILPSDKIAACQEMLLRYKRELPLVEGQILAYERTMKRNIDMATEASKAATHIFTDLPTYREDINTLSQELGSNFLFSDTVSIINQISRLPEGANEQIEGLLSQIKTILLYDDECRYALDLLLKKMGTVTEWSNIQFKNPEAAYKALDSITFRLSRAIDQHSSAEDYARLFSYTHGFEVAYSQCAISTLLPVIRGTILDQDAIYELSKLQCSDPFWVKQITVLSEMAFPEEPLTTASFSRESSFALSQRICNSINEWYNDPRNSELKEAIQASVRDDREKQKVEIAELIETQKEKFEEAKAEVKRIMAEIKNLPKVSIYQKDLLERSRREYQKVIDQNDLIIANIPQLVRDDAKYWPWGFLDPSDKDPDCKKDPSFIASFLFAKQEFFETKGLDKDLLPGEFRTLLSCGVVNRNIFQKNEDSYSRVEFPANFEVDTTMSGSRKFPDAINFSCAGNYSYKGYHIHVKDRYLGSIKNESIKKVSLALLRDRIKNLDETDVPVRVYNFSSRINEREIGYDEITDLFSIAASPDIQIDSLLSHYTENPEKFSNHDWVNLFHGLLFDRNLLQRACENPQKIEHLATRMREMFNPLLKNAIELEDYATASTLIWLAKSVQNYLDFSKVKVEPIVPIETVIKVIEKGMDIKHSSARPLLLESTLAYCKELFRRGPADEAEKKLFAYGALASLFYLSNPPGSSSACIPRSLDAKEASFAMRSLLSTGEPEALYKAFKNHAAPLMQKMFPALENVRLINVRLIGGLNDKFTVVNSVTHQRYGQIALTSQTYIPEDKMQLLLYDKELPNEIMQMLRDQCVFGDDQNIDFQRLRCSIEAGNLFYIRDPQTGLELRVLKDQKQIYVATEVEGRNEWLLHVANKTRLANHELAERYCQRLLHNKIFLVDPTTQKPVFSLNGKSQLVAQDLIVANPKDKTLFTNFEDPACTVYLADKNTNRMQEIRFVRLGITLKRRNDSWELQEQPGWRVADPGEQFMPHMGPKTGFLVITNSAGEKKVLLPVWDPKKPENEVEGSLNKSYSYEFDSKIIRKGRFVECSLDKDQVTPLSLEARFHLARIYLETGSIDEAEELLFSHQSLVTHRKHTPEEISILKAIATSNYSGDIGSRTIRARLQALVLLEKNAYQFGSESNILMGQPIVEQYLERLRSIRPLDPSDELFILRRIAEYSHRACKRIAELQPGELLEGGFVPEFPRPTDVALNGSTEEFFNVKTTFKDRMRYFRARLANTFPFDPTTVTEEQLHPYYNLLVAEARRYSRRQSWNAVIKRGFMQGITVMTQSNSPKVKGVAYKLYFLMRGARLHEGRQKIVAERIRTEAPATEQSTQDSDVAFISRNLAPIETLEAQEDADSFVVETAEKYFTKQEKSIVDAESGESALFHADAPEIKDATIMAKFKQAKDDMAAAQLQLKETTYTLKDDKDEEELRRVINERLKDAKENLATLEATILTTVASALVADPISAFGFSAKKRSLPTIEELAVISAKLDSDTFIKKLYPELSDTGIKQLQASVKQYLVQKQFVQHLERSIQQLDALIATTEDKETLRNVLGRNLEAERAYSLDDPHAAAYLYIETVLNIKMRQDQIQNIQKFINGIEEGRELVLQMIMGAGKTSVLQPILGFLFARSDSLSCVDVPEALYEPVKDGLHKALGNAYRQFVYAPTYERERAKDIEFLKAFYSTIQEAKDRGGCLLRSPRLKHSILTSFDEASYDYDRRVEGAKERLELVSKIVNFLQRNEVVQIDENDLAMNSKTLFKFPVGSSKAVFSDRASLLSNLLLDAVTDPQLLQTASLDFANAYQVRQDPGFVKTGASLTPELYANSVKPRLVQLALTRLESTVDSFKDIRQKSGAEEYLTHFLTQSTPYDQKIEDTIPPDAQTAILQKKDLSQYDPEWLQLMTNQAQYKEDMNGWIRDSFKDVQDREMLGSVANAIKNILPSALFKESGSHYGPDPKEGIYVARPYAAPKTPKISVYADAYEQVVYSTEMVLYYGIPKDAALKMLKQLQKLAKTEIRDHVPLIETDAYQKFQMIMGNDKDAFALLESPPSDAFIEAFTKNVSKNRESILEFLQYFVFPQIKIFECSLMSTPQALATSSRLAYGYTGTLNRGILSRTQEACPEAGTDGKTILSIQSKMDKGIAETRVYKEQDGKYTDQLINQFSHNPDLYVFIDSGGWLKEEKIDDFAKRLLASAKVNRPEIEAVVYHNDKGQIVSLEPEYVGSKTLIEVPIQSSRFKTTDGKQLTIIQQRYETGTNIPQKPTAKAIMSVRKGMTKREGLQSAFRMRQLLYGQSVSYALTEEVKDFVATGIIDGLLSKPEVSALFTKGGALTQPALEALALRGECKETLIAALQAYNRAPEPATPKERISAFSKCFAAEFSPDSVDIWAYKTVNEALEEQGKNWDAGKQKMREVILKPLRMLRADPEIPLDVRMKAYKAFEDFIIQTTEDSPFSKITQASTFLNAEAAIEQEVQKHMKLLKRLDSDSQLKQLYHEKVLAIAADEKIEATDANDVIKQQLDECVHVEDIPAFIEMAADTSGQELEQEVEQEQETEKEVEQERELEVDRMYTKPDPKPYNSIFSDLRNVFSRELPKLSVVAPKIPLPDIDKIEISPNLYIDHAKLDSSEHGRYHLPGRYIMMLEDADGKKRYLLVSTQDAAQIQKAIYRGEPADSRQKVSLLSFDGKVVVSSAGDALNPADVDERKRICLQAKVVSGKANYSKEEIALLDTLLDKDRQKIKQLRLVVEKLLSHLPHSAQSYSNSLLRKYFKSREEVDKGAVAPLP